MGRPSLYTPEQAERRRELASKIIVKLIEADFLKHAMNEFQTENEFVNLAAMAVRMADTLLKQLEDPDDGTP